jgi:hypothetical protein
MFEEYINVGANQCIANPVELLTVSPFFLHFLQGLCGSHNITTAPKKISLHGLSCIPGNLGIKGGTDVLLNTQLSFSF